MQITLQEARKLPGVETVGSDVLHGRRSMRISIGKIVGESVALSRKGEKRVAELRKIVSTKRVERAEQGLNQMTKDELEAFAKEKHGVDLDKRKSLDTLRSQLEALMADGPSTAD